MSIDADRARDLLDALDLLSRHRGVEPTAYRAVHAAATQAVGALHSDLLDPRAGDFDAGMEVYGGLARRLRAMPLPSTGQTGGGSALDPLMGLLARGARSSGTVDALLGDVTKGMVPKVERVVRDGLREMFQMLDRAGAATDEDPDRSGGEADARTEDAADARTEDAEDVWTQDPPWLDEPAPDDGPEEPRA